MKRIKTQHMLAEDASPLDCMAEDPAANEDYMKHRWPVCRLPSAEQDYHNHLWPSMSEPDKKSENSRIKQVTENPVSHINILVFYLTLNPCMVHMTF